MKVIKIITVLLACIQLASCQTNKETGFVLEKNKLYYNSKEIALGMPVEKFTDAMGMYDRIDIDSSGGEIIKNYFWKNKLIRVNKHSKNDFYYIAKLKIDKKTGKLINDYNFSLEEEVSFDAILVKYGNYDSIKEDKTSLRISKFFIWDELGISLAAYPETNVVGNIFIQTLHITKFRELDLGLVKTRDEQYGHPPTKEILNTRENDIAIYERRPKKEYKGNFTYNGKTINLKQIGNTDWEKGIKGLGIDNSDYDPPGDSPQWSRWIRKSSDLNVTFQRFSNMDEYDWSEPKREDIGDLDCIQNIVIWWNRTD
ncbi:hypothetical protein ACFSX9_05815 [Flavobacterium ardleyense]|uniref:DUF7738 domain-containing protein n=1 Tax=Flavobacterium ardleyense TaxID=2038737 RepID=A0ABW5Z6G9_9FLAO